MPNQLISHKSESLKGRVRVPGDKSISHRALMLGGLATGTTRIKGLLEGHDVVATAQALTSLGAVVEAGDGPKSDWIVKGRGVGGLAEPDNPLDFGNSGTGVRLMMGVIGSHDMRVSLLGDESLSRRPMGRVLAPLTQMGVVVEDNRERLPLVMIGSADLVPIEYTLPVPSAQVKSAILFAGLHTSGATTVIESAPTRDHTERMLTYFGAELQTVESKDGRSITIRGDGELHGRNVSVPGDPSSAAFLAAAAVICEGSEVTIENVLVNPTRTGFYKTLDEMGADIALINQRVESGEDIADVRVRSGPLTGVTVPPERAPTMIDEYPCLAVLAAFAEGTTRMEGLGELRVKESDRLTATAEGLAECGVNVTVDGDTLNVRGAMQVPGGATVRTHMDHRIAMAFAILGFATQAPVAIDDDTMIATSFPGFTDLLRSLGARIGPDGEVRS